MLVRWEDSLGCSISSSTARMGTRTFSFVYGYGLLFDSAGGLVLIRFVGSQQGVEILRLEDSIFLSTLLLFYPSLGE